MPKLTAEFPRRSWLGRRAVRRGTLTPTRELTAAQIEAVTVLIANDVEGYPPRCHRLPGWERVEALRVFAELDAERAMMERINRVA